MSEVEIDRIRAETDERRAHGRMMDAQITKWIAETTVQLDLMNAERLLHVAQARWEPYRTLGTVAATVVAAVFAGLGLAKAVGFL